MLAAPRGQPVPAGAPRRAQHWLAPLLALLLLAATGPPAAGSDLAPVPLLRGRPLTAELTGGHAHHYRLDLAGGRYARLLVTQRGIDVMVRIATADGETLTEIDGPDGVQGTEAASLLSGGGGSFRVVIESLDPEAAAASYTVELVEERPEAAGDASRVAAERLEARATAAWGGGGADGLRQAIDFFLQALPLWQEVGDLRRQAATLTHVGYLHRALGELAAEVDHYLEALELWRRVDDQEQEAAVLNSLGAAYASLGETDLALEHTRHAAELFHRLGDRASEGAAYNILGSIHRKRGEPELARELFDRSLALRREAGDRRGEARTLNNLGLVYYRLGEVHRALGCYREALAISREIGDRRGESAALNNLSTAYDHLGEVESSLEHYHQALDIAREIGDQRAEAVALSNIGTLHKQLGETDESIGYYRQALALALTTGDRFTEAAAHCNLGWAAVAEERYHDAEAPLTRCLEVAREIGDREREVLAQLNLSHAQLELGDPARSQQLAAAAGRLARDAGDRNGEAWAQLALGEAALAAGDAVAALDHQRTGLAIWRDIDRRGGVAQSLLEIGRAERALGNLDAARQSLAEALDLVESLRTEVAVQEMRSSFLASKQEFYESYIDLLMELDRGAPAEGWDARALRTAERARARGLLDALAEVPGEIRHGVDPALLAEERRLRQRLNARERDRGELASSGAPGEAEAVAREIQALRAEYRTLEARIRTSSPRYAALTQPEPLSSGTIRQRLLDADTVLLEYSLGRERSYLWAVTVDGVESWELPPRTAVEAQARQVYDLLTARNRGPEGETPAERQARIAQADLDYAPAAAALAATVLAPAAPQLAGRRLLVVADGALQLVPFAALPDPGAAGEPLAVRHEVVGIPSASVLDVLRRDIAGRQPPRHTLAVLADPVFDADDPRVTATRLAAASSSGGELRGGGEFRRLRFSRREARAITELAAADDNLTALDFDASRATATGGELRGYRYLHFATHGVLNTEYPELSGLVLSLVDERGEPQDGFLRLHDIYNLDLAADLVTLSACDTALGREIRGEGLIGLSRGFMYAGAARVVASLWQVQDRASAEIMRRFYTGVLTRGETPAAALRAAQVSMWQDERWKSPYYWAPFVLHGEWR